MPGIFIIPIHNTAPFWHPSVLSLKNLEQLPDGPAAVPVYTYVHFTSIYWIHLRFLTLHASSWIGPDTKSPGQEKWNEVVG